MAMVASSPRDGARTAAIIVPFFRQTAPDPQPTHSTSPVLGEREFAEPVYECNAPLPIARLTLTKRHQMQVYLRLDRLEERTRSRCGDCLVKRACLPRASPKSARYQVVVAGTVSGFAANWRSVGIDSAAAG